MEKKIITYKKPKILLVSFRFPPHNHISSLRIGKMAKYLDEFGWDPWVLTVDTDLTTSVGSLPIEIDKQKVIRANYGRLFGYLMRFKNRTDRKDKEIKTNYEKFLNPKKLIISLRIIYSWATRHIGMTRLPDRALVWCRPAIKKGKRLLREQEFDAIFSSHGPPSSHLVASVLTRNFGIPWVADFRDPWSQNHITNRNSLINFFETCIEKRCMRQASELTTVSMPWVQQLENLHKKTVTKIPNGYDEEDYNDVEDLPSADAFVIVYTGQVIQEKQDPTMLFEAVKLMNKVGGDSPIPVEVHFFGCSENRVGDLVKKCRVKKWVKIHSRVSHQQIIRKQVNADALLLLEWTDPSEKGVYPGKIFEYLGARKPILAVGPKGGVVEELLNATKSGRMSSDIAEVLVYLRELLKTKKKFGTTRLNTYNDLIKPYTRRYQAQSLVKVLNRVRRS